MTPFFDNDGLDENPDLMPKPDFCLICKKKYKQNEANLCLINRIDQRGDGKFICIAFENINETNRATVKKISYPHKHKYGFTVKTIVRLKINFQTQIL